MISQLQNASTVGELRPQQAVESDLWSSNAYVMSGFSLGSHYYNVSNNLKSTLTVDYTCFHFADPFKFTALWWKRKYLTHIFFFQYKTEIFVLLLFYMWHINICRVISGQNWQFSFIRSFVKGVFRVYLYYFQVNPNVGKLKTLV